MAEKMVGQPTFWETELLNGKHYSWNDILFICIFIIVVKSVIDRLLSTGHVVSLF